MTHRTTMMMAPCIWLACLCYTSSAGSMLFLRRSSSLDNVESVGGWGPTTTMSAMTTTGAGGTTTIPAGCNCAGQGCGGAARPVMTFGMPVASTTMAALAQPPIAPPPPPLPLPGPPPPLPLAAAKPLPGLPGLPMVGEDWLPTLGPPPLAKMTPAPTMPPPRPTYPPVTTPGPTTPIWVETKYGWIAGTTPNPYMTTMAPSPFGLAAAPAPATAMLMPIMPIALAQGSWMPNPMSFLQRSFGRHSEMAPCNCPCDSRSQMDAAVDQQFSQVLNMGLR